MKLNITTRKADLAELVCAFSASTIVGIAAYHVSIHKGLTVVGANLWMTALFLCVGVLACFVSGLILTQKRLTSPDKLSIPSTASLGVAALSVVLMTIAIGVKPDMTKSSGDALHGSIFLILLVMSFVGTVGAAGLTRSAARAHKVKGYFSSFVPWLFFASCAIAISCYPYLGWWQFGALAAFYLLSGYLMVFVTSWVEDENIPTKAHKKKKKA